MGDTRPKAFLKIKKMKLLESGRRSRSRPGQGRRWPWLIGGGCDIQWIVLYQLHNFKPSQDLGQSCVMAGSGRDLGRFLDFLEENKEGVEEMCCWGTWWRRGVESKLNVCFSKEDPDTCRTEQGAAGDVGGGGVSEGLEEPSYS